LFHGCYSYRDKASRQFLTFISERGSVLQASPSRNIKKCT